MCVIQPSAFVGSFSSNSSQPSNAGVVRIGVLAVLVAVLRVEHVGREALLARRRRPLELREAEVAERVALGVLLPGPLAGVEQLAALVEEGADRDHLLDREAGGARPRHLVRPAGQVVVAGVPDDRVVVVEHAQQIGRGVAHAVDVVDVVGDAVGVERVGVVAEVVRAVGILRRVAGQVVLGGQHEHLVARLALRLVGEVRRVLRAVCGLEPDLHLVTRLGALHLAAQPLEVDARRRC